MQNSPQNDELFDVQYDICELLFERIREQVDGHRDDLAALRMIRDQIVQAVANMENVTPESVYHELEEIRTENT